MKFSRKATKEDFEKEAEKWVLHLSHETREALQNGTRGARFMIKKDFNLNISIQQAGDIEKEYMTYWNALNDFYEGKDVFVEY